MPNTEQAPMVNATIFIDIVQHQLDDPIIRRLTTIAARVGEIFGVKNTVVEPYTTEEWFLPNHLWREFIAQANGDLEAAALKIVDEHFVYDTRVHELDTMPHLTVRRNVQEIIIAEAAYELEGKTLESWHLLHAIEQRQRELRWAKRTPLPILMLHDDERSFTSLQSL